MKINKKKPRRKWIKKVDNKMKRKSEEREKIICN